MLLPALVVSQPAKPDVSGYLASTFDMRRRWFFFFFQAEDGIRDVAVTGVQTCALPIYRLSKSRYLAGLQCHKQLWWRVHEPDAPELVPNVALRNRFAQGAEVDQRARGYVPGGELIDLPFYEYDNKVAATRDAIRHDPPVLYQPWFLADETYAGVDILTRGPRGYDVIEVKAANRLKPEHVPDVAVQVHVLRRSGLAGERAEGMDPNPGTEEG